MFSKAEWDGVLNKHDGVNPHIRSLVKRHDARPTRSTSTSSSDEQENGKKREEDDGEQAVCAVV